MEKRRFSKPTNYDILSEDQIEILKLKRKLMDERNLVIENQFMSFIHEQKADRLAEELQELKEYMAENDIAFGDSFYGSDRGNDMTHGG